MLNKQGPGKIDWCDWTWNPISGCKHGCPYCYMLRMEKRFPGIMEPKFKAKYLYRFEHVRKVKQGDKIFVGSSGDMWGAWNKHEWIRSVYRAIDPRPDVIFQFLTKNPGEYLNWHTNQGNCWYGTSVDGTAFTKGNVKLLVNSAHGAAVKFCSFEPLINIPFQIDFDYICDLDWIIIGADSSRGAEKPPKEWANALLETARSFAIPVWVKDNYGYPEVIKEFPKA